MKLYAFDVDHTLTVSDGPIGLDDVWQLREDGHITGLCGNWARVTLTTRGWHRLFSFVGPHELTKAAFLRAIEQYMPADEYIMVGNDEPGKSLDGAAAREAGWRFIKEDAFASGER